MEHFNCNESEKNRLKQKILFEKGARFLQLNLSSKQKSQFGIYIELLLRWNQKMNLFSAHDQTRISERHVLESIAWIPQYKKKITSPVMDLGTGAGFPGIPLAILLPELEIVLVDSKKKKVLFLEKIKKQLDLKVQIISERVEKLTDNKGVLDRFPIIISRAVTTLSTLLDWSLPFLKPGGRLLTFKGDRLYDEIDLLNNSRNKDLKFDVNVIDYTICKNLDVLPAWQSKKFVEIVVYKK